MENYLTLFEEAISKQAEAVGEETALLHARKAGLGVSKDGRIISCVGNPQVVLLKLIKNFASTGSIEALTEVSALIDEIVQPDPSEKRKKINTVF